MSSVFLIHSKQHADSQSMMSGAHVSEEIIERLIQVKLARTRLENEVAEISMVVAL
jgi:hypothetical protein